MKIAVLGTGVVGNNLASSLVAAGHEVRMGARDATNAKAAEWASAAGTRASHGTFADAAAFGDVIINCTAGRASVEVFRQAGAASVSGKIIVDLSNPLDFSKGMPPTLTVCNDDSVAEQLQRAFPDAHVVKTLNTINTTVMTNPALVPGDHDIFVAGNSAEAKQQVIEWLGAWFGWKRDNILDLGDITAARPLEMWVLLWVRIMLATGTPTFNIHIVRG